MHSLVTYIANCLRYSGYFLFEQEVADSIYSVLRKGYASGHGEVEIVRDLTTALNSKAHGQLSVSAQFIHGAQSFVEFSHLGKPTTRELGDMVVIAVVTSGGQRLFQRVCIIQNKIGNSGRWTSWKIDKAQLFLLKNFPVFTKGQGIFKTLARKLFRNWSDCLGTFGLLSAPGEMTVVSARLLSSKLGDRGSIRLQELSLHGNSGETNTLAGHPQWFHHDFYYELLSRLDRSFHWLALCSGSTSGGFFGFLGNSRSMADVHDFTKSWLRLSLGEITLMDNVLVNPGADAFALHLIRRAGIDLGVELPANDNYPFDADGGGYGVAVVHLAL